MLSAVLGDVKMATFEKDLLALAIAAVICVPIVPVAPIMRTDDDMMLDYFSVMLDCDESKYGKALHVLHF